MESQVFTASSALIVTRLKIVVMQHRSIGFINTMLIAISMP